ncbi:MAG: hypothetical protein ACYC3I_08760 [Gemmataceae bacterium]
MTSRPIYLMDQSGTRIADLDVVPVGDHFEGTISLETTPSQLRHLFEQFEEIVEGQIFSLLDDIEEKIGSIPIQADFENGSAAFVWDLQVFPNTNSISFKTRQPLPV